MARWRVLVLAVLASAAVHAAVMIGMPKRLGLGDDRGQAVYSATLEALSAPSALAPATPQAVPPARARRAARARPQAPAPQPEMLQAEGEPASSPEPLAEPPMALAALQPVSVPDVRPFEELRPLPDMFPVEAMPSQYTVHYALSSSFAEGRAVYRWDREGDNYRITAQAQAEGFFALFLEGQIVQESRGTVTATGLKPERFTEQKPGAPVEGLEFDWGKRRVTFESKSGRKTEPLQDNTVDWLTMIFQLAHQPPQAGSMELRVFTQSRLYSFNLQVLGTEEIQIPIGKVKALHLRHVHPRDANEVVDVWLGVEQHYVPVKLRFPVARNRLMVEQVATRVTER